MNLPAKHTEYSVERELGTETETNVGGLSHGIE